MSIDIQKQINFRAQNNNIINAPQQFTNEQVQQPVDEEKSNASKWMIGLTATAAIVIGGIWAAKKGHLGESAQKYANKLLGNTSEVKSKGASTSSGSTTTSSSGVSSITPASETGSSTATSTVASVAAAISPLVVARKAVSKLIKSPKNYEDVLKSLQQAGIEFLDNSSLILEAGYNKKNLMIKTGKKATDFTYFNFDENGILTHVFRPIKGNTEEIFEFSNGSLKSITRQFDGLKVKNYDKNKMDFTDELVPLLKPLKQTIKFDDNKKAIEEIWEVTEYNVLEQIMLTSVKGQKGAFNVGNLPNLSDFLAKHYDDLPPALKKAKFFQPDDVVKRLGDYDNAPYLTARVAKYCKKPLKDIPQEIPSEEFVRFWYSKTDQHFSEVVNALDVERNIARRVSDAERPIKISTNDVITQRYASRKCIDTTKIEDVIKEAVPNDITGRKAEVFAKLFKDDLGPINSISEKTINEAVYSYNFKFKAYGLDKNIDLMETSVKPLKECSYDEVVKLIKQIAPDKAAKSGVQQDPWKNKEQEQEAIFALLRSCTGQSGVDGNTKLFDLLKDIAL